MKNNIFFFIMRIIGEIEKKSQLMHQYLQRIIFLDKCLVRFQ